jgi:hypothetical protein
MPTPNSRMSNAPGPSHNLDVPTTPLKPSTNGRDVVDEDDFMTEESTTGGGDANESDRSTDGRHPRHNQPVSNLPSMPLGQIKRQQLNAFTLQCPPVIIQNVVATCNLGE